MSDEKCIPGANDTNEPHASRRKILGGGWKALIILLLLLWSGYLTMHTDNIQRSHINHALILSPCRPIQEHLYDSFSTRELSNLPIVNVTGLRCPSWTRNTTNTVLVWLRTEGIMYSQIEKSASSTIRKIFKKLGNGTHKTKEISNSLTNGLPPNINVLFTFVRDPVERFLSAYIEVWRRRDFFWLTGKKWIKLGLSLPDQAMKVEAMALFIDRLDEEGWWNPHLRPQTMEMANTYMPNCLPFDFVGRVENFERDMSQAFSMAGGNPDRWRAGVTKPKHRASYLNDKKVIASAFEHQTSERKRKVCRLYYLDFINLDYPLPTVCKNVSFTLDDVNRWSQKRLQAVETSVIQKAFVSAMSHWYR